MNLLIIHSAHASCASGKSDTLGPETRPADLEGQNVNVERGYTLLLSIPGELQWRPETKQGTLTQYEQPNGARTVN